MDTAMKFKQTGMTTLTTSIMLLTGVTMISLFGARASINEQRIALNQYVGENALEQAKQKLATALDTLNTPAALMALDNSPQDTDQTVGVINTGNGLIYEANGSWGKLSVTATGSDANNRISRSVRQSSLFLTGMAFNGLPAPMVVRGKVDVDATSGSTIGNNGHGMMGGGSMGGGIGSNTGDHGLVFGTQARGYTDWVSTGMDAMRSAAMGNMTQAQFFNYMFGFSQSDLTNTSSSVYQHTVTFNGGTGECEPNINQLLANANNASTTDPEKFIVYINCPNAREIELEGERGSGLIGSDSNPVIVIVNGNVNEMEDITINGLLYVTGSLAGENEHANPNNGDGRRGHSGDPETGLVNGAMIIAGDLNWRNNYEHRINTFYDEVILNNLGSMLGAGFVDVPGSWTDL